jgi:hypothetical protein
MGPRDEQDPEVRIVDKNLQKGVGIEKTSLDLEVEIVVRDPGKGDEGPGLAPKIVVEIPLKEKVRNFLDPISTRTASKSDIQTVAVTRRASVVGRRMTGGRLSEKPSRDREKNLKPNHRRRRRKTKLQLRKNLPAIITNRYKIFLCRQSKNY